MLNPNLSNIDETVKKFKEKTNAIVNATTKLRSLFELKQQELEQAFKEINATIDLILVKRKKLLNLIEDNELRITMEGSPLPDFENEINHEQKTLNMQSHILILINHIPTDMKDRNFKVKVQIYELEMLTKILLFQNETIKSLYFILFSINKEIMKLSEQLHQVYENDLQSVLKQYEMILHDEEGNTLTNEFDHNRTILTTSFNQSKKSTNEDGCNVSDEIRSNKKKKFD